jgi:hypothetical protein
MQRPPFQGSDIQEYGKLSGLMQPGSIGLDQGDNGWFLLSCSTGIIAWAIS